MAIVKMKRISLLGLLSDREKLLKAMQRMQCVEITDLPDDFSNYQETSDENIQNTRDALARIQWAFNKLSKYDTTSKPMFGQYPAVSASKTDAVEKDAERLMGVIARLEQIEQRSGALRAQETRILASKEQYLPWSALDTNEEELSSSKTIIQIIGTIPTRGLPDLEQQLAELPVFIHIVSQHRENSHIYVAIHSSIENEAKSALEAASFTQENLSSLNGMSPSEYLKDLDAQAIQIQKDFQSLEVETEQFSAELANLKILHDLLTLQLRQEEAAAQSAKTSKTFYLQGWIPAVMADKAEQKLKSLSPSCTIVLEDPKEGEEPSILLENNSFGTAFEPVVEGFAYPSYHGIDPTAIMAPFYACLFGMMVSDAGYGLVMTIALFLFVKIKKISIRNAKMLYLLMFGGIATVFWGLIFNTVIGFNPLPRINRFFPLDPVNDPMPVMMICLAIGALHLFAGLGTAAYMNIRRKDWVAVVSDQFSWLLLLIGLGFLLVPSLATVGKLLAIAGFAIILVMTGRDKKNPFKRLISGLGALYGITGWVSDLLSYMRLFGMGLATGVIGMVFNILIGMLWSGSIIGKIIAIPLFVVCHLFNLGINALGAYVHACRLQYIEFFSKFYQDGGKVFRPLDMRTRYVNILHSAEE